MLAVVDFYFRLQPGVDPTSQRRTCGHDVFFMSLDLIIGKPRQSLTTTREKNTWFGTAIIGKLINKHSFLFRRISKKSIQVACSSPLKQAYNFPSELNLHWVPGVSSHPAGTNSRGGTAEGGESAAAEGENDGWTVDIMGMSLSMMKKDS